MDHLELGISLTSLKFSHICIHGLVATTSDLWWTQKFIEEAAKFHLQALELILSIFYVYI